MIKDDNKRVVITLTKEQSEKLDKACKANHLSKSSMIGLLISGVLAYESGKAIGDSFGKYLFGRKD